MCADQHHPWGFTTGLPCLGTGENHPRQTFANPAPPKLEEPTGLGAVVEATAYTEKVRHFVRTAGEPTSAWVDEDGNGHAWIELDDPRVLSEGVQP